MIMTGSRFFFTTLFALLVIDVIISGAEENRRNQILGGRLAMNGDFGGVVTLAKPGHFYHLCGGVVIGPRFILTAGHCVNQRASDEISVRAGIHDIRDTENAIERLVSKIFIHPNYTSYIKGVRGVRNDLAVLVLKEPLQIRGRVSQFQLPEHQPKNGIYFIAGWGYNNPKPTDTQFELKALTMKLGDCDKPVGTICASSEQGSSCPGDSGSPLVRSGYVYGIVSAGNCGMGAPTTFTNVFHYIDWVKSILTTN